LKGVRVLIVEDDAEVRSFLARALEAFGAAVRAAASGPEAIEALTPFRPYVLVSDIQMPGQDGFTLIRAVRRLSKEQGGRVPAIALTAIYTEPEDRARLLWSGFQMYVRKPVDPQDLASRVAKLATPEPEASFAPAG
jgi:CheY-like chemotaxis protein